MVGAAAEHALAVEVHLRPVLVELGASMPTCGLYVLESQLGDLDAVLDPWLMTRATAARRAPSGARRSPVALGDLLADDRDDVPAELDGVLEQCRSRAPRGCRRRGRT